MFLTLGALGSAAMAGLSSLGSAASGLGSAAAGGLSALGSWAGTEAGASILGGALAAGGSIGSSLLNSNSASHSAAKSYHYSKLLFDYQQRKNLLEGPSMQLAGLRKAGVNPLVAYGNIGSASQSMPSFSAPMADQSIDLASLGRNIANIPTVASQLKNDEQARRINWEKLGLDRMSLAKTMAESDARIRNIEQDTVNKRFIPDKVRRELAVFDSQISLNNKLAELHSSNIGLNSARIKDLENQMYLRGLKLGNPSDVHNYLSNWLDFLKSDAGTFSNWLRGLSIFNSSSKNSDFLNTRKNPSIFKPKPDFSLGKGFDDFLRFDDDWSARRKRLNWVTF